MKKLVFHGALRVRRDIRKVRGKEVYYKISAVKRSRGSVYEIEVKDSDESRTRCLGKDKYAALEIYNRIVSGRVTPCSLDDIADDFLKERKLCN